MNRYIPETSKSTSILGQSGQKHGVLTSILDQSGRKHGVLTSILDQSGQKQELYD